MIGICVKTNGLFTLLKDYEINFYSGGPITVKSDNKLHWFISYQGDGHYGCTDCYGKEVSFLVE